MVSGMPSPGYCTILQADELADFLLPPTRDPVFYDTTQDNQLDAGSALSITGPRGVQQLTPLNEWYSDFLGGIWPGNGESLPEYLEPGVYNLANGEGGADVGTFTATLNLVGPVVWTNRDSLIEVPRDQDLTLFWSGSDSDRQIVAVYAQSWDENYQAAVLLCTEWASAGQFTVPSWMLAQLPESGVVDFGLPNAFLGLITMPTPDAEGLISVSGIDGGRFTYAAGELKYIGFR